MPDELEWGCFATQEARLWVKSKVQPHAVMEEELSLGGGQAADRGIDFLLNYVECVRYLFFIEKRAGLQALLDLVQAQFSKDITEVGEQLARQTGALVRSACA